jgi:opacity protein-like surface antigen
MKKKMFIAAMLLSLSAMAGSGDWKHQESSGLFSLGTRNTISAFNHDNAVGKGIGGQFRIQFSNKINTEWYADYIVSKDRSYTSKTDYHVGWSVMYYLGKNTQFEKLLQPYLIAGHCFDYSIVSEQANKDNSANRLSMATQAGIGTHINITKKFDCSLSGQYMLHFGKEIETDVTNEVVTIEKHDHSSPDGHLLFTLSFNYKFGKLW